MAVIKKPGTSTAAAASAEKKTTAAKPAAKSTTSAAKTTKAAAKKTTSKATEQKTSTAKKAAAKTTTKKTSKKPSVTIETICKKVEKALPATVPFTEKIAVDIEVWGFEDGSNAKMYIEAKDGKVTVSPHTYEEKDFRVAVSFANAKAFVDGKVKLKDLLASPDFYAEGNIVAAVKLASIFA